MDTDDLSDEAYQAIMVEAENFNPDLTLQFGLLSSGCENEKDFITKSIELIDEIRDYDEHDIDDLFFGEPPPNAKRELKLALDRIIENIKKLKAKP